MSEPVTIVPAQRWHAHAIIDVLPESQRSHLKAWGGETPVETIERGIATSSHTWTALEPYGMPVLIGGVVRQSLLGRQGLIWQVSNPEAIARHPKRLLRESRAQIEKLREHYDTLVGYVGCDPKSLVWLKWLGFDLAPAFRVKDIDLRLATMRF